MSRSKIIGKNKSKVLQAGIQINRIKNAQISLARNIFNTYNNNYEIIINSSTPNNNIVEKKLKNDITVDNLFLTDENNINKFLKNKKIIKLIKINNNNKNLNKSQTKSNITIKDIAFYQLKKPECNKDEKKKSFKNINRIATNQNNKNINININMNLNKQTNSKTILITKNKNKINKNIYLNSSLTRSLKSFSNRNNNITFTHTDYFNHDSTININNNINNRVIFKEKILTKGKLNNKMNIRSKKKLYDTNKIYRKISNSYTKISKKYNSLLLKKNEKLKNINITKTHKNLNFKNKNFSTKLNILGANKEGIINKFNNDNLKTTYFYKELTHRNSSKNNYFEKNLKIKNYNRYSTKNTQKTSKTRKNENYRYINKNIYINNIKFYKRILLKDKNKNINLNNNIKSINLKNNDIKFIKYINKDRVNNILCKNKNTLKEIDKYEKEIKDNRYDEDIKINYNDKNIITENKNNKKNSSEKKNAMYTIDEIKDIIIYNDMHDIKKEDNYLFNNNEYSNFINKNTKKICEIFFDENIDYLYRRYDLRNRKKKYFIKKK